MCSCYPREHLILIKAIMKLASFTWTPSFKINYVIFFKFCIVMTFGVSYVNPSICQWQQHIWRDRMSQYTYCIPQIQEHFSSKFNFWNFPVLECQTPLKPLITGFWPQKMAKSFTSIFHLGIIRNCSNVQFSN